MSRKLISAIWPLLREAHDHILEKVRYAFESQHEAPPPLFLVLRAAEDDEYTNMSITLPDERALKGLLFAEDRSDQLKRILEILDPNAPANIPTGKGSHEYALAVFAINEGQVVKIKVLNKEQAESLDVDVSTHPDREDAIVMMVHTLAGSFPVIHPISISQGGDHPRSVQVRSFPTMEELESLETMRGPASIGEAQRPPSTRLH